MNSYILSRAKSKKNEKVRKTLCKEKPVSTVPKFSKHNFVRKIKTSFILKRMYLLSFVERNQRSFLFIGFSTTYLDDIVLRKNRATEVKIQ